MASSLPFRTPLRTALSSQPSTLTHLLPLRTFTSTPYHLAGTGGINRKKLAAEKLRKKRKRNPYWHTYDLKSMPQFSLCDAIRYIKAFELGRDPTSTKYEAHIKFKSKKNGPVIRQNQMHLPHPVKTDVKFCYLVPEDNKAYQEARDAGASYVGDDSVIARIKAGAISFDRCFAHPTIIQKLQKEGVPRILGPKGLMPNPKNGTVIDNPRAVFKDLIGGALYKEKMGVVRMAVGQLGFTPEMLRDNLKAVLERLKKEAAALPEEAVKILDEVVLSSTNSPGFSLNGTFRTPTSPTTTDLSVA